MSRSLLEELRQQKNTAFNAAPLPCPRWKGTSAEKAWSISPATCLQQAQKTKRTMRKLEFSPWLNRKNNKKTSKKSTQQVWEIQQQRRRRRRRRQPRQQPQQPKTTTKKHLGLSFIKRNIITSTQKVGSAPLPRWKKSTKNQIPLNGSSDLCISLRHHLNDLL